MTETEAKLQRLRALLADYSYSARRSAGMLAEIDALLAFALRAAIKPGARAAEVEAVLGPPQGVVGDESRGSFRWLYPSACSLAEAGQAAQWYYALGFEQGELQSVERSGWSD